MAVHFSLFPIKVVNMKFRYFASRKSHIWAVQTNIQKKKKFRRHICVLQTLIKSAQLDVSNRMKMAA